MFLDLHDRGSGEGENEEHPHFNRELFLTICSVYERAKAEKNTLLKHEHFMVELLSNPEVRAMLIAEGFSHCAIHAIGTEIEAGLVPVSGDAQIYTLPSVVKALSQLVVLSKNLGKKVGGVYFLYCLLSEDSDGTLIFRGKGISRKSLLPYLETA